MIKIFSNPKKGHLCFGHFFSENYVIDNKVYMRDSKHGIFSIKKV